MAVRATTASVYDFVPLRVAHACLPAALGSLLGMPISKFIVISVSIYFTIWVAEFSRYYSAVHPYSSPKNAAAWNDSAIVLYRSI
jgi:hypothetical protein